MDEMTTQTFKLQQSVERQHGRYRRRDRDRDDDDAAVLAAD
jgi:hypothetical protein